ncbi:uncharacterized protein ACIQIH_012679 isoform 1-T2 [Cyanocitta cristata]
MMLMAARWSLDAHQSMSLSTAQPCLGTVALHPARSLAYNSPGNPQRDNKSSALFTAPGSWHSIFLELLRPKFSFPCRTDVETVVARVISKFLENLRKKVSPTDFNSLTLPSAMKPKLKCLAWVTWYSYSAHSRYRNLIHRDIPMHWDPKHDFIEDLKTKEQERGNIMSTVKEIKRVLGNISTVTWF